MLNSSELKKELIEIQSLAQEKFKENLYQRLLVTTIALLVTLSIFILVVSLFIKDTLLGDFLLNLGTDFIGSTIIFIAFSIVLKPNRQSEINNGNFRKVIIGVLAVSIFAFIFAILNNNGSVGIYLPQNPRLEDFIWGTYTRINVDGNESNDLIIPIDNDGRHFLLAEACPSIHYLDTSNFSTAIVRNMKNYGLLNSHVEGYSGQDFVNEFMLSMSSQFLGSLIIFIGVEQLFHLFSEQQNIQKVMLEKIEQLAMKIE